LGVRGVVGEVVQVDDDDGGRGFPGDVLADLTGRTEVLMGEHFALGDEILPFFSGVDDVMRIAAAKLTFKAEALCGRGLMGLACFSSSGD